MSRMRPCMSRATVLTAGSIAGLLLATAGSALPAAAAGATQLVTYSGSAESWGLNVRVVPVAQKELVADVVDEYFPHTTVDINATPHAFADGEFFDPGAVVRVFPGLVNGQIPHGGPLPSYPYIAQTTSDPSNPRDVNAGTSAGFTPVPSILPGAKVPGVPAPSGFGAGTAQAHADARPLARASGAVADVNLGQVKVGSLSGVSSANQAAGTVVAITTAVMKNIDIVGVLHIGTETVTGTVQTAGSGAQRASGGVSYADVTVAGVAASIDQDGLHIGGNGVPTAAAQGALQQLNQALAASGARIVASQATTTLKDATGDAVVEVDGFAVSFADPQNTVSVLVSFGHAGLLGHALTETVPAAPEVSPLLYLSTPGGPPPAELPTETGASSGAAVTLPFPPATGPTAPGRTAPPSRGSPGSQLVAAHPHALYLPVLAGLAELSLLATLACAAWIRSSRTPKEENLLAL